jgi:protease IV
MDFEPNQPLQGPFIPPVEPTIPPPPPPVQPAPMRYAPLPQPEPKPKRSGWRVFWTIILVLSILGNGFLFFCLIAVGMALATQGSGLLGHHEYSEQVLFDGNPSSKIVVIRLEGIIDRLTSEEVRRQIEIAGQDPKVRGVIIRTITPGGTVSASDQIHRAISQFREQTNKPVIAFMETVAASGGYYTSVACDRIIAEPTAITGSIGVIMSNLVMQRLLEDKLGIQPVVIKSGLRKDWPSMYALPSEEQKQYLSEKLVQPAYERFLSLVVEGRKHATDDAQIRRLADGSIFTAPEALAKKLIDAVGYMEDAVELAQSLAGISNAQVVEYKIPFSLANFLGAQSKQSSMMSFDRKMLDEMATPRLMYLWDMQVP